ncbi:ataxin-10 [Carya illinoinensis]|uniref:ataxin-10 n=1 Tax=Carya illinoinensis TaxID=32201 RepID=UPI001C7209A7|nr:ataxin-10 [Carya illinoinensis]XP_042968509.1 ataxin-10 [Carya illinoinensis]XP_042968510.1 ataxin-10 [Carya illinoinensis]XP_042968511.1 ataxin-10 [Carya illinoinensis]XP_042968512.1 ataxin-10 [Carya illinoinensis]XP_042968513.1 ataxin-10 [Carya illinoinensis]XP_042968514.1 ataxin-10 [Carya illinoinensis]XP_042968515.1 ataxin-10 [Carya illinoinensis]XP_042968516.1 ataxin-10 [Carya illinoinensis]XP_042968517.1 ataxin-10 [Carya illinoinensis]XP_042968518.1 ataxin-10 [Carya illinoinensis
MGEDATLEFSLPQYILAPLLSASNSYSLEEALENLIKASRTDVGRKDLASKKILSTVLQLSQSLPYPSGCHLLTSSLKLLRNLCAGEIANQDAFIEQNGVDVVSTVLRSAVTLSNPDYGTVRMGLQVLANVCLAGEEHQCAVWNCFFPDDFVLLTRVRSQKTCDPLCMVLYTCCDGSTRLFEELCSDFGLPIVEEIVRTTSAVGFGEDWLKLILSRICLEEPHYPRLFSKLSLVGDANVGEDTEFKDDIFLPEQAFLSRIVSEILNERLDEIFIPNDFVLFVFEIFKRSVGFTNSISRCKSGLPTGSASTDVLGYALTILRDICASKSMGGLKEEDSVDAVDMLLSAGLVELLLCLLGELEPPGMIRKSLKLGKEQDRASSYPSKPCLYQGFRRDIVAVIGNCAYGRKHVQDGIRHKNGIPLLLQQCVTDEDNPFLREWGIWCVRNILEQNAENQRVVAELELQGSVDVPELTGLGLRVEVDPKTRRAKLVNVP